MRSQATNQLVTTVGRNIQAARAAKGLTQRALAIKLGVDTRAVGRWETGGITPGRKNLAALAEKLERDPGWFYTNHQSEAA